MQVLDESPKPPFNPEEIRLLGCLMEKQLTTPANYPLTINSLMLACNQKTSREPIMNLKEGDVGHLARSLIEFGYVTIQNSGRAQRVEHRLQRKWSLTPQQQAVLAVLMLRRPQTLNEIKLRTERMAEFKDGEIQTILTQWQQQEQPLVMKLPASAGQREDRYYHTLGDETLAQLQTEAAKPSDSNEAPGSLTVDRYTELLEKLAALEQRVARLEAGVDKG